MIVELQRLGPDSIFNNRLFVAKSALDIDAKVKKFFMHARFRIFGIHREPNGCECRSKEGLVISLGELNSIHTKHRWRMR